MKTKYLFLLVTILLLPATNASAACPFLDLLCYIQIFRAEPNYQPTYAPDGRIRLTNEELRRAGLPSRNGRLVVVGEDKNCRIYDGGCMDCQPAEVPKDTPVDPGDTRIKVHVRIQKDGQNYLHPSIMEVLKKMAASEGKNVIVTSGYRSCAYQKNTQQGVSRSMHLKGRAADFHIEGKSYSSSQLADLGRKVLNYFKLDGGTGMYCGAFSHVDTGNTREWNYCK